MPTERASAVARRAEAPRDEAPQVPALTLAEPKLVEKLRAAFLARPAS